jgi:type I restriction-modification system DNA methylase subunit
MMKPRIIRNAMFPKHYEQMLADMATLEQNLTEIVVGFGAYYTPAAIVELCDPACGSGSYLIDIMEHPRNA